MPTCKIEQKYLVLPVNLQTTQKEVRLSCDGKLVQWLSVNLDGRYPNFYAYVDVQRFFGKTLTISSEPEIDFAVAQCNAIPVCDDPLRPKIHFTTKNGWNNDPNGLIYLDGTYHLFYQYNPCSVQWGNMHWGHATSTDLVHWEEKSVALFPDELGTMFSGSAILDKENRSGLGTAENPPVLLFYTAAGNFALDKNQPYTQCVAYSTDGCKTFQKYAGNPIVSHIEAGNRDPKVIWCEPLGKYVMALYLDEDRYALLSSENLLDWTQFQEIALPGDNECPDFFPLRTEDGEEKWILIGAHDCYLVGTMQNGQFVPEQEVLALRPDGIYYAAQTFSNLEDGRVIRIGWSRINAPGGQFSQQMSIPAELSLCKENGLYRLVSVPVPELNSAFGSVGKRISLAVSPEEPYVRELTDGPVDITIQFSDEPAEYQLTLFGREFAVNTSENVLKFSKYTAPLSVTGNAPQLRMVVDTCSVEIFADGGRINLDVETFPDYNLPTLCVSADRPVKLASVLVRR